jgi:hypothetical protein
MFSYEDMTTLFQPKGLSKRSMRRFADIHYCRSTFAYILRFVKDRVHVDWESFIDHLHHLVIFDEKLLGSGHAQDLFCSVDILDVYSFPKLFPNLNANVKEGLLKRWKIVPSVVCITFQVPKKRLDILKAHKIGIPVMLCSLMGTTSDSHHIFTHFRCFWGQIKAEYSEDPSQEPAITFDEDPEGFQGTSPAIFTFYVPASMLGPLFGAQEVALQIQPNLDVVETLYPLLGSLLVLFSAALTDRRHVHITRERPGNPGELQKLRNISFVPPTAEETQPSRHLIKVTLDSASRQITLFTGRVKIKDRRAKASLTNRANVSVEQISPRVMQIYVGSYLQNIVFPFPVDSSDSRTRISKKQSFVEVSARVHLLPIDLTSSQLDVKLSGPEEKLGMSIKPFPLVQQDTALSLWNIHYVDLEQLPVLDLSSSNKLSFLWLHVKTSYSYHERRLCAAKQDGTLKEGLDVITGVKQCIQDLVTICSGLVGERCCIFGLSDPENFEDYTLISSMVYA